MKPIPIIIGATVLGSITYIAKYIYKEFIKNKKKLNIPVISGKAGTEEFYSEFVKIADNFESLYHELFAVCHGNEDKYSREELINIINGWQLNIKSSSTHYVERTWNGLMQKYFQQEWFVNDDGKNIGKVRDFLIDWYQNLHNVGIKQDNRTSIKVKDYTLHHYYVIPGIYDIGDDLEVERPCWTLNNKCIERGVANIIRKQE